MDWSKITYALLMLAMLIIIFPRAKQAVANSPKATKDDWMGFIKPMAFVVIFIIVLIMLVR